MLLFISTNEHLLYHHPLKLMIAQFLTRLSLSLSLVVNFIPLSGDQLTLNGSVVTPVNPDMLN